MPIRASERGRYPADWPAISKRIRRRARGRCECKGECGRAAHPKCRCRERNSQPARTFRGKVVLTVAHLNHVPEDVRDENLKAMCQACHLSYDRHHHAKNARETRRRRRHAETLDLFDRLAWARGEDAA